MILNAATSTNTGGMSQSQTSHLALGKSWSIPLFWPLCEHIKRSDAGRSILICPPDYMTTQEYFRILKKKNDTHENSETGSKNVRVFFFFFEDRERGRTPYQLLPKKKKKKDVPNVFQTFLYLSLCWGFSPFSSCFFNRDLSISSYSMKMLSLPLLLLNCLGFGMVQRRAVTC